MKLISSLDKLLIDHVNLNKTRVDVANDGFATVTKWLKNDDLFGPLFVSTARQGSIRQGTIIKPQGDADFDVDMLFTLKTVTGWQARDYSEMLHNQFKKSDRYKDIVDRRGKTRCVTLDYESDFHLDIVPSIVAGGGSVIMNRGTNQYELTDGDGYAAWFHSRNAITGGKHLVRVVRLIKYARDINAWEVKSIVLTTLLGGQVIDQDDASIYSDTATALTALVGRVDELLQTHPDVFDVTNPALESENFNRHWNQDTYRRFRKAFHRWNQSVERAFGSASVDESLEAWQECFGEEFELADEDAKKTFGPVPAYPEVAAPHAEPLSKICAAENPTNTAHIDAYLYSADGRTKFRGINSPAGLRSGLTIKYQASTSVRGAYDVWWRVVNTGKYATADGALRGNFFKAKLLKGGISPNQLINWESTRYTGHHWIECFVVQNKQCIARARFDVNIKNPDQP